jgi:hypothetical protein
MKVTAADTNAMTCGKESRHGEVASTNESNALTLPYLLTLTASLSSYFPHFVATVAMADG